MPWHDQSKPGPWGSTPPPRPAGRRPRPWLILTATGVLLCLWIASGVYRVGADDEAVVTTFGAYQQSQGPGWHYHLPAPLQGARIVSVTAVHRMDLDANALPTADQASIDLHLTVQWRIADAGKYLFGQRPPETAIDAATRDAAQLTLRQLPAAALTDDPAPLQDQLKTAVQRQLDDQGAGVDIVEVKIGRAAPAKATAPGQITTDPGPPAK